MENNTISNKDNRSKYLQTMRLKVTITESHATTKTCARQLASGAKFT